VEKIHAIQVEHISDKRAFYNLFFYPSSDNTGHQGCIATSILNPDSKERIWQIALVYHNQVELLELIDITINQDLSHSPKKADILRNLSDSSSLLPNTYSMSNFHEVWIEQCAAAEGIREQYGVKAVAAYLIGEKLLHFLSAAQEHPEFADELPKFIAQIKSIIEPHELTAFFDDLAFGNVFDPSQSFRGDPEEGIEDWDVQYDAEKILLVENAKALLLS
jgi:hypothetical protein